MRKQRENIIAPLLLHVTALVIPQCKNGGFMALVVL